ncbi:MAG: branched-chain amino acid ABC transporter permease [Proteobacteria bacterium]|nr:branched-chain amino acid ABC transporter permease [Pseudomonadota bacterium]
MNRTALIVCAVLAALIPLVAGDYYINLSSQILIAAVFALSLNLLVGYGGLTSLGHAAYMGVSAYLSGWLFLKFGMGHLLSAPLALLGTTLMAALFGLVALRASGIGFLMITLALGQVLWGLAFRWVTVTNGDNGLSGLTRPMPFGIDLTGALPFYYFTLIISIISIVCIAAFAYSAFGAVLRGTRDQPRRMLALGHNVWMVRYVTFITAGFWSAVSGLLYVYYHKFIHPAALALTNSAEVLLMVIAGGTGTLIGPVVGAAVVVLLKNYVSAYVERWTMLLGFVFLLIVLFMPDGLVPGVKRLWMRFARRRA